MTTPTYLLEGQHHSDFSAEYMTALGLDDEQQRSVLAQRDTDLATHYQQWKAERQAAVNAITVEVDGMVFDGNTDSTHSMAAKIAGADDLADTTEWTLADNTVSVITISQLKAALRIATDAQTRIWNDGRPA